MSQQSVRGRPAQVRTRVPRHVVVHEPLQLMFVLGRRGAASPRRARACCSPRCGRLRGAGGRWVLACARAGKALRIVADGRPALRLAPAGLRGDPC